MSFFRIAVFQATFFASFALQINFTSAQFEGMLARVPRDSNTLIFIDAEKMFGSPIADKERWEAKRKAAFDSGVSALPPNASTVVMAASIDFESGKNDWELSLVKFPGGQDVATVAKRFGGSIDTISGRMAARLPDDHYIVQISPELLGSHTPAQRQDVSRWLAATDKTSISDSLSPYLLQAYGYATKVGTPIVMAIDLSGAVSPTDAAARLNEFESLTGKKDLAASVARLAGNLQGATLGITLGGGVVGAIRVDFSETPEIGADVLKPIVLEVIKRNGAMIDDFENWQPSVQGNTFMLKGNLTTASTRRVLSVLELPTSLAHSLDLANSSSPSGSGGANPSKIYFQSVTALLDDLRMKPKTDGVKTAGQAAIWYDKYARKIDRLPILGVDSTLLNYGGDIASGLRDANSALRGIGMRTSVRTVENDASGSGPQVSFGNYSNSYGGYGGYGFSYFNMRSGDRVQDSANAAIRMQERVGGVSTVQTIWKNIDEATSMIRREMTQKYEIEF